MSQKKQTSLFFTSIIYLCGFFLFLEWIYPTKVYDDTSNLTVFVIYAAFCFLISLLQVRWWASFLLKGFSLLFIINSLYFVNPFLSKTWLEELYQELLLNIHIFTHQHWLELTDTFRSILFLFLIWLMSYLIYYWFITMRRVFVFIILTFIYITVLDTFTMYDGSFAIIRIFIISFIAFGITNFLKETTKESIQIYSFKKSIVWVTP